MTREVETTLYSQKQKAPTDRRRIARNTNNGPAAPVRASPARSSHLKHRKTCFAQIIAALVYSVLLPAESRLLTRQADLWNMEWLPANVYSVTAGETFRVMVVEK